MEGVSEREPVFSKSHALARFLAVGYFPRISGRAMAGRERDATRLARFSAHLGRERENERNQTGPKNLRVSPGALLVLLAVLCSSKNQKYIHDLSAA